MTTAIVGAILAILGLVMGSFAGATIWRLRARQLVHDKTAGESVDSKEFKQLKPLLGNGFRKDRSRCLHCQHELAWYDLVPIVSWVSAGGRCRYCHVQIGWFEPVIEVMTAVLFVGVYLSQPIGGGLLAAGLLLLWLVVTVLLVILAGYDTKWFLLPDSIMLLGAIGALIIAVIGIATSLDPLAAIVSTLIGVVILGGLYFLLWVVSKGGWVGFGDVKLGVVLGLLLGGWQLAFLTLFLANLIGCFIVLPGLMTKKLSRKSHVPFGPMLIAGFFLSIFFGHAIIAWYLSLSSGLAATLML